MRDNRVSEGYERGGRGPIRARPRNAPVVRYEGLSRPDEVLFHFIWRHRYFNQHELATEAGEPLQILSPGVLNSNQGPDFLQAMIRIGGILFEGPVEIHLKTSDWLKHGHDGDNHYREVILHVVWENDLPLQGNDIPLQSHAIPILVLRHRISKLLLAQYHQWMTSQTFVPCERRLNEIPQPDLTSWQQQLVLRRLQQRTLMIRSCLEENCQHWEETTWWLMARSFGQPVNAAAFEAIGRSLRVSLMARHRDEPTRLEALLLGQAGLLEDAYIDEYPRLLQKEYRYCRDKYKLQPSRIPLSFLRMRPGHFPTIRLVQLAALMAAADTGWFARIRDAESWRDIMPSLRVRASGYWDNHYTLDKPSSTHPKQMGETIKRSLLINAFIPMLYASGSLRGVPHTRAKALRWLEEIGPESNSIITGWRRLGVAAETASATQALLELKKNYCRHRKCLDCLIGQTLLGQPQPKPAPPLPYSS
jgi:hypothetical protein